MKKMTKRPGNAYNYPSNSAGGCSIFTCGISEEKFMHKIFNGGERCNTPILTPFALNVDDVYIVINRGVEVKAKIPTMDYHFMFR